MSISTRRWQRSTRELIFNPRRTARTSRNEGSTLVVTVLVMSLVTVAILASTLGWTTADSTLSQRNNEYYRSLAMAEGATEAVITQLDADYKHGGEATLSGKLNSYQNMTPTKK